MCKLCLPKRSCWNNERYIGGSYSYHKIGQTAADCDVLAKPVPSKGVSYTYLNKYIDHVFV